MNYYSHHIGDFDKATRHLTRIERSIYRDLIELYYDTEQPISLDFEFVCRKVIARTNEEVTAVKQVLNEFFTETPTGWFHARCDEEIEKYLSSNSQKSAAGRASAAKRKQKRQQALNDQSTDVERTLNAGATNVQLTNNQEPLTKEIKNTCPLDADGGVEYTDEFNAIWAVYPKRPNQNKRKAFKAYKARINAGVTHQMLMQGVVRYANYARNMQTEPRFIKACETFLGPDNHFLLDWHAHRAAVPAAKPLSKADQTALWLSMATGGLNQANSMNSNQERGYCENTIDITDDQE